MKDISTMNFGEALQTVRKSSKELGSRIKLAAKAGVDSCKISSIEKGESLPTKKQLNALCDALGNEQLREKGLSEIEYKRTHPDVKICFSDKTVCWKCGKTMCSVYGLLEGSPISPDGFSEEMLQIAQAKGVVLEERKSGFTGESHIVNVCPHCGAFIGDFYLHDLWYGETEVIQVENVSDFIVPEEEE